MDDATPTGQCSVVIADDADDVRFLLRMVVESHERFTVLGEARTGAEAIDLVKAHRPDLILLDVSMPVMDGLEAIPLIRAACEKTKILMVSGLDAAHVEPTARSLGAHGYIEKGVRRDVLMEAVSDLCDQPTAW